MKTRDTYALLIAGNEKAHEDTITLFQLFLLGDSVFDPARVRLVLGKLGNDYLLSQANSFFQMIKESGKQSDVVIAYNGHGNKKGFEADGNTLPYEELGRLIDNCCRYFFINDSCYSGTAIPSFERLGLLPLKGQVLTSSASHEKSYGGIFLSKLMRDYLRCKSFTCTTIGFKKSDRQIMEDGTDYIRLIEQIQYPQRAGITLGHLLFAEQVPKVSLREALTVPLVY